MHLKIVIFNLCIYEFVYVWINSLYIVVIMHDMHVG